MMKIKHLYIFVIVVAWFLCGCGNRPIKDAKPVITVSLEPQKYFLDKIVGDKMQVECLLKNGANPESYEPAMNDFVMLERSVAYLKMGNMAFENSIVGKLKQNNNSLVIFDTSRGVEFIMGTHDCCEHHHNHSHHHEKSADPHSWTSVKNAKVIARNMLEAVLEVDSANTDYYRKNYENLIAQLDSLDCYASERLISHRGEAFLVWHPSLSYFARDYGLEQITIGQIGKELSARQLQEQIEKANAYGAKVFFFQQEFDSRQASVVNDQIGAEMITINPLNYEWETEIRRIIDAIASK